MSQEGRGDDLASEQASDTNPICGGCANPITSKSHFVRTNCGHTFHKSCLSQCMKSRPFCPICNVRVLSEPPTPGTTTRSQSKSQNTISNRIPESQPSQPVPSVTQPSTQNTGESSIRPEDLQGMISSIVSAQQAQLLASLSDQIARLVQTNIESRLSRSDLNGRPASPAAAVQTQHTSPRQIQTLPSVEERTFREMFGISLNNTGNQAQLNSSRTGPSVSVSNSTSSDLTSRPDKVLHIMSNWKIKFNGNINGLSIENFIYRVKALTLQTLQGDFDLLCRNASSLFEGKAADWFWRYHRSVPVVSWQELCRALRQQYSDSRTDIDIRELIRDRKQNRGESFDVFYESIVELTDRLKEPLSETMLVEVLRRNLQPEIQHEILNLRINSLQELRNICRKREFFLQDVRRKQGILPAKSNIGSRRMAELDEVVDTVLLDSQDDVDDQVSGISLCCWNCHQTGHRYQDCLSDRTVFCYGCGAPNTYKPNCLKCNPKNGRLGAQKSAPGQGKLPETGLR